MTSRPRGLLHGEVGDVGRGGDLELEHALRGGGAPVEHRAVHRGEGVARDHRGLDGQLLDVGLGLLGGGGAPQNISWTTDSAFGTMFTRHSCA